MFRSVIRRFTTQAPMRSAYCQQPRKTLSHISELYRQNKPISVVTAWDFLTGKITEKADIDITLIGDSLAMVALGYDDTNEISLNEMMYHVRAVARGNRRSFLVADVPFGTFESSDAEAIKTAILLVKEGRAQAVKIEASAQQAPTIKKIVDLGVPVMGHVGLAPQKHNTTGGYKLQGNTVESAQQILEDCKALEKAGVFALLLECVPTKFAEIVTRSVSIPVIGIGAGPHVSGQVLVMADMLGMNENTPAKFVKQYMNFAQDAHKALSEYKSDLATGTFPDAHVHGYKIKSDVLREIRGQSCRD